MGSVLPTTRTIFKVCFQLTGRLVFYTKACVPHGSKLFFVFWKVSWQSQLKPKSEQCGVKDIERKGLYMFVQIVAVKQRKRWRGQKLQILKHIYYRVNYIFMPPNWKLVSNRELATIKAFVVNFCKL